MTASALLALFSLAALQDLTGLLKGMHGDGEPSYGMQQLTRLFRPGPDTEYTAGVLEVWFGYGNVAGTATPLTVTWWYVIVDAVFLIAYLGWLFLWLRSSVAMFDRWSDTDAAPPALVAFFDDRLGLSPDRGLAPYLTAAKAGRALLPFVVIFEVTESRAELALVKAADLHRGENGGELSSISSVSEWSSALWVASCGKWIIVALLVGIALAAGWIRVIARLDDPIRMLRTILRLRIHVTLVALLAGILLVHEQIPDVIRRWEPAQLGLAIGLAGLLAISTWAVSRRLLLLELNKRILHWNRRRSVVAVGGLAVIAGGLTVLDLGTSFNVGWGVALPAILAAVVLLLNLWFTDGVATEPDPDPLPALSATSVAPRLLASATLVIVALAILRASFGYAVYVSEWEWGWLLLLLAPALALAGLAVSRRYPGLPRLVREPLVWGVVGASFGYLAIRISYAGELHPTTLVASALLIGVAAWRLYPALQGVCARESFARTLLAVAGLLGVAIWVLIVWAPFWTGEYLGGIGVIMAFLILLCLVGGLLVWVSDAVAAPVPLRFFQLRRWPIFFLLALWFVAASVVDKGDFHNVRSTPASQGLAVSKAPTADHAALTLQHAFDCWLVKNGLPPRDGTCAPPPHATQEPRPVTPMFLVSTSGGGIRAAYWTALTLDCAFELEPEEDLRPCVEEPRTSSWWRSNTFFAGSGISGGSLGLASYAAYLATKSTVPGDDWVDSRLKPDALSASIGWWLFVEFPRSILRFDGGTDRAEILERGWERGWGDDAKNTLAKGIFEFAAANPQSPLLLLNATSVEDGCRFNASVLDANVEGAADAIGAALEAKKRRRYDCRASDPFDDGEVSDGSVFGATRDLADFLCRTDEPHSRHDLPLSSAALLSGRFPYVSLAGRLERRCESEGEVPVTYIVDGGYLEPSGAGTILDLTEALEPLIAKRNEKHPDRCVVPYLIQIDNGTSAAPANDPRRPQELLVPLQTLFSTRGARGADARADAGFYFSKDLPRSAREEDSSKPSGDVPGGRGDRYIHFQNKAHPGPQAPLGWTLSEHSRRDLTAQLENNASELATVRKVLAATRAGTLTCG